MTEESKEIMLCASKMEPNMGNFGIYLPIAEHIIWKSTNKNGKLIQVTEGSKKKRLERKWKEKTDSYGGVGVDVCEGEHEVAE